MNRAIQVDPKTAEYHNNLATVLDGLQRHEDAVASYRRAMRRQDDLDSLRTGLGRHVALRPLRGATRRSRGAGDRRGAAGAGVTAVRRARRIAIAFAWRSAAGI